MPRVSFLRLLSMLCCLLAASFTCQQVNAQGICIPEPLTVAKMAGRVIHRSAQGEEPLADAVIEVYEDRYNGKLIKKALTDRDGCFSLKSLRPGRYLLKASKSPYMVPFAVRVNLVRKSKADHGRLSLSLGTNALEPCGGGTAAVKNESQP